MNITDSFNRTNNASSLGATDTGETWTARSGTGGILSNQAYFSANGASDCTATVPGRADGTTQCTFPVVPGASGGTVRLVVRCSDNDNQIYADANVTGNYVLRKKEAGTATALATGTATAANNDVVKIVTSGTSLKVYVNNVLDIDTTSTFNQSAVNVGIGTDYGLDGSARFDVFSFTAA